MSPSRYSGGSMSRPLGSRLRERLLVNSFFTISHFLLLVTTFSHLCPKPYPVSSKVAKLASSVAKMAITPPIILHFVTCMRVVNGGKLPLASPINPKNKSQPPYLPHKTARNRGKQAHSFKAFRANALTICGKTKTICFKPELPIDYLRHCAIGFSQRNGYENKNCRHYRSRLQQQRKTS